MDGIRKEHTHTYTYAYSLSPSPRLSSICYAQATLVAIQRGHTRVKCVSCSTAHRLGPVRARGTQGRAPPWRGFRAWPPPHHLPPAPTAPPAGHATPPVVPPADSVPPTQPKKRRHLGDSRDDSNHLAPDNKRFGGNNCSWMLQPNING